MKSVLLMMLIFGPIAKADELFPIESPPLFARYQSGETIELATTTVPECAASTITKANLKKLSFDLVTRLEHENYKKLQEKKVTSAIKLQGNWSQNRIEKTLKIEVRMVISQTSTDTLLTANLTLCDVLRISAKNNVLVIQGSQPVHMNN